MYKNVLTFENAVIILNIIRKPNTEQTYQERWRERPYEVSATSKFCKVLIPTKYDFGR